LNVQFPGSLRSFPLVLPGGTRATFRQNDDPDSDSEHKEEVVGGEGWRMLRRDEDSQLPKLVGLVDAVERYGRKRSYSIDQVMEGVENPAVTPPRKKSKGVTPAPVQAPPAAPISPLPSPGGSPSPQNQNIWPSAPPSGASSPQPQPPIQPDVTLTTLMTLPNMLAHFTSLPPQLQSHVLLTFLRHSPLSVLRTLHSVLTPTLARDFLTLLPLELASQVLSYLPYSTLTRASRVSKSWRAIIDSDHIVWRDLLKSTKIWFGGDSERAFARDMFARRRREGYPSPRSLPDPHPYKVLFKSRHLTRSKWINNQNPKHLSFPAHGRAVVTCLLFSHGRIISASDDHSIHVYSPITGNLVMALDGHEGGVWALAATKDILVSGSTDRTVRIWDLSTGRCTHVFGGHTSTVRCLSIVKPEWMDIEGEDGVIRREKWPKRPLIVTGSRDHTLRVWLLPRPGEGEYRCYGNEDAEVDPAEVSSQSFDADQLPIVFEQDDVDENPFHKLHLEGHDHAVRALAARGRTLVSGSYDCTVRIWDIITGDCKWILVGHTQKGSCCFQFRSIPHLTPP
jgi:F-box and WD-40 domain protein CDC4